MIEAIRLASGRVLDQDVLEGSASMYHIPDLGRFLKSILPELARRAREAKLPPPVELGISTDDERWMIHIQGKHSRVEPDKLSRRHLSLKAPALVRLLMGHTGDRRRGSTMRALWHRQARRSRRRACCFRLSRSGEARWMAVRPEAAGGGDLESPRAASLDPVAVRLDVLLHRR